MLGWSQASLLGQMGQLWPIARPPHTSHSGTSKKRRYAWSPLRRPAREMLVTCFRAAHRRAPAGRRRRGPRRRSPLCPPASPFISDLLILSPPVVHPRPTELAPIHGPLLPPSLGPSPVVHGASDAPPLEAPIFVPPCLHCPPAPSVTSWLPSAKLPD